MEKISWTDYQKIAEQEGLTPTGLCVKLGYEKSNRFRWKQRGTLSKKASEDLRAYLTRSDATISKVDLQTAIRVYDRLKAAGLDVVVCPQGSGYDMEILMTSEKKLLIALKVLKKGG